VDSDEEKCPLCRANLSNYNPTINERLRQLVKTAKPLEFQSREELHVANDKVKGLLIKKKFAFGNLHKKIKPKAELGAYNGHEWTVFVKFPLDVSPHRYVQKVRFELHPTFKPSVIEMTKQPFEIKRIGWGYFTIPITIYWQEWLKMPPTTINHTLCFDENGQTRHFTSLYNDCVRSSNN